MKNENNNKGALRADTEGRKKMFGKNKDQAADIELFTVFDSKSKSYEPPLLAPNKDVLLRDILNRFKDPKSPQENKYYINAEDYSLFRVGTFDKKSGTLVAFNQEHVVNFHDLRALAQPSAPPRDVGPQPQALFPT